MPRGRPASWSLILLLLLLFLAKSVFSGTLTGSFAIVPAGSTVDLTAQGPLDWVHWGMNSEFGFDRKASVPARIGTLVTILSPNGNGPFQFSDGLAGYSWSDGIPNTFGTNTPTGVYAVSKSSGFQLTVAADTVLRRLKVYVGAFGAQGQFSAALSDGSAPAYSDTSLDNADYGPGAVYTLNFAANSSGQTLTLTFVVNREHDNKLGNVTWEATALANASSNNPPTATLTNPTNNAIFSGGANISLAAVASDSDGTISKVEFYQSTTKLGQDTTSPFTFTWTNAPAGDYLLRAVATDNAGLSYTSKPVEVFINTNAGFLSGTSGAVPYSEDLTADGTMDWAHWGFGWSGGFDRKSAVPQRISNATVLGTNALQQVGDYVTYFSWSDGTPTPSAFTPTGVSIVGFTNGFVLTVPATNYMQTLTLYLGLFASQGNLQVFLSDFSAPAFCDTSLQDFYNNVYGLYTINFWAAAPNRTLTVRWTSSAQYDATFGNVTLEAATLSPNLSPQPVVLLNPAWKNGAFTFSFLTAPNRTHTVQYSDVLPLASWQTLQTLTGNGAPVVITNTPPVSSSRRIYRVGTQ